MNMNLIKYLVAFAMLTVLSACGGGGGSPGASSGGSSLFTTAPATLSLTNGATSPVYTISGGVPPYTVGTDTPSLISAPLLSESTFAISTTAGKNGSSSVTIVDHAGKTVSVSVTVLSPSALFVDAPENLSIAVGAPGNTYTVSGGIGPYTAQSSNTAVATVTTPAPNGTFVIQGISAGSAAIVIKDAIGTALTVSVTVPAPAALFSTAPATLQILSGTTNFYTVFGGTAPYVVNANGTIARAVLSGASLAITGLVPGHQTVAVSDAKGAVITIDVTVNSGLYTDAPANLSVAIGTGATYSIYGGVPYSGAALYRVNSSNPGVASATIAGSTLSISGMSSGSTALVISDSLGATTLVTVTVPAPGAILTTAPSSLTLGIGTSGDYAISGGVGAYSAKSSNPALVSATVSGSRLTIGAVADTVGGTANVIVSDSAGTAPVTIVVTAATVQFFTTAPAQLAIASGSAKIFAVFGGSLPYSVVNTNPAVVTGAISTVAGATTLTITGMMAGSGIIVLSDAKGVSVSIAVVVNAPGPLFISAPSGTVFLAPGNSITYNVIGGVPEYVASSTDLTVAGATIVNANQVRIDALAAGSATIAVTDLAGTKVSVNVTVGSSNAFFVAAPSALNMGALTSAGYQISGGAKPYSVSSSAPGIAAGTVNASTSTLTVSALAVGTATLQVSDALGATYSITVVVSNATGAFFVAAPSSLSMGAGTSVGYGIGGGSKPYAVSSSDIRVATGAVSASILTVNALSAGTATLQVSDALGVSLPITVVVDNSGGTGPTAAASIDILASGNSLNSTPGSSVSFIVTVKDSANAALPGQTVTFSASSGTLTGANPPPATNAAGTISTVSLSSGSDASIRNITVTATAGTVSKSITIPVVGTTLTVSGQGSVLVGSAPQNFTLKAADSAGKPVVGASLTIASALLNGISPTTVTTGSAGSATVAFTATIVGNDTLTVTGLGTSSTAKVSVSADNFHFVTPLPAALLKVGVPLPPNPAVTAQFLPAPAVGTTVNFATTRGTLYADSALTIPATTAPTDLTGSATVYVKSDTAGPVTLSAQLGTASTSVTVAFIATVPASVVLQANPAAIPPNASGSTTNQSALTAVVRDAIGNPVQGAVVNFTAVTDGSAGSIAPGSVTTDAYGQATAQFIAGPLSTATNAVVIQATVQGSSPLITSTALLTVNGSALFISIARSGTLTAFDSTTYEKDFSVYLTDATGAPAGNRVVTLSVWPTTYGKGKLVYDSTIPSWVYAKYAAGPPVQLAAIEPYSSLACLNEDANPKGIIGNGIIDPLVPAPLVPPFTEDTNGNGKLDPGSPTVITPSVTTDALGFATFTLRYGKNYAWWVSTQITAKSLVSGTESKQIQNYDLEMSAGDAASPSTPANVASPFGFGAARYPLAIICSDPS